MCTAASCCKLTKKVYCGYLFVVWPWRNSYWKTASCLPRPYKNNFESVYLKGWPKLILAAFLTYLCDLKFDLRLDLSHVLGDLRFDLTKIASLRFDLRFDLTKFAGWWLDLRFDVMKVWTSRFDLWLDLTICWLCDLIWGLTWTKFDLLIWLEIWFDF